MESRGDIFGAPMVRWPTMSSCGGSPRCCGGRDGSLADSCACHPCRVVSPLADAPHDGVCWRDRLGVDARELLRHCFKSVLCGATRTKDVLRGDERERAAQKLGWVHLEELVRGGDDRRALTRELDRIERVGLSQTIRAHRRVELELLTVAHLERADSADAVVELGGVL